MREKLYAALKEHWGYDEFRPLQLRAMESVCGGHDTLVLMPTGGGKSLLYQVPAMVNEGVCIVITPLIALMKDQVDRLRRQKIPAVAVHSGLTQRQIDIALDNCVYGDIKFLYIAPERIASETFQIRVRKMTVSLVAVDEAHCISQWGYDFRPSYLRICEIRKFLPNVGILALTASATPAVAEDIMNQLEFREGVLLRSSFARDNLSFIVRHVDDKQEQLLRIINNVAGSGIVYVRTREATEQICKYLQGSGISAEFYNGGLNYAMRSIKQDAWSSGKSRVMVATNAFGMGIDKADVRFVVHYDICDSLEGYYQEAGRAGRDSERSYAVMLCSSDDRSRAQRRFDVEFPSIDKIKECYESVFNYLQIGIGDGKFSIFSFNRFDFCTRHKIFTPTLINAMKILQQNGYMTLTEEQDNPPRIMFIVNRDDLYKVRIEREELNHILRTIMRLYNGLFNDFVPIDTAEIAHMSGYTVERTHELLKKLWEIRVIKYIPGNISPLLIITEERLPLKDLYITPQSYQIRKEMSASRVEGMFQYSDNQSVCRSKFIGNYFGESDAADCGCCDVCLARKKRKRSTTELKDRLIVHITDGEFTLKKLVDKFSEQSSEVLVAIDEMVAEGKISVEVSGKVKIIR